MPSVSLGPRSIVDHFADFEEISGFLLPSFVVSGFGYRIFGGGFSPYLLFLGWGGVSLGYLRGFHSFVFSGRFCRWCGAPLVGGERLGLCSSCYFSPRGVLYRSVVEGCDGFSSVPSHRYVVYLGSFGDVVKVGVSRFDRGGVSGGFLFRLLEQGVGRFAVFDGGWSVCDAQRVERELVEEFGFVDRVSFLDKVDLFFGGEVSEGRFSSVVADVLGFLGGARLVGLGYFPWVLRDFDFVWGGDFLVGEVVGFRGNLVVFDDGSSRFAVDLSGLVGRGVVCGEV